LPNGNFPVATRWRGVQGIQEQKIKGKKKTDKGHGLYLLDYAQH